MRRGGAAGGGGFAGLWMIDAPRFYLIFCLKNFEIDGIGENSPFTILDKSLQRFCYFGLYT